MNKACKQTNKKNGFTLVELAIVLTIVALIIGGIIGGEKLVDGYRLASVVSGLEKYKIAYNEFQTQYMSLPGDMSDASSVWSGASSGNGDGKIQGILDSSNQTEEFKAWQHLGRASLIPGLYSGNGSAISFTGGTNVPSGPHENSMYRMAINITTNVHELSYSKVKNSCNASCSQIAVMTPSDAYSIDLKIDDGIYNTGKLTAPSNAFDDSVPPVSTPCIASSVYNSQKKGKFCTISYTID